MEIKSTFWQCRSVRYGMAVAATLASALLRWVMPNALASAPYLGFYPAVVVAAVLGGVGPGLLATVASLLVVNFVFGNAGFIGFDLLTRYFIWSVGGTGVSLLAGRMHIARRQAEAEAEAARKSEEALRESEERWATTLQSIGDAVISTDAAGKVVFMNEVAQRLTGWSLAEAKGKELSAVFNIVQEQTRIRPENPVTKVLQSGKVVGLANHTALIRRDGTEIPIDDSGAPIRNKDGEIEGVVLVFHDVSEQRRIEKVLRETDRLATTGRLAASIAHEIHNPLDVIGNLLHLIAHGTQEDETKQEARLASDELERLAQMTQQMLTFQRESTKPVPVQIKDVIENVLALYHRKLDSARIQVQSEIDAPEPLAAHPGELRQVFANLIGNAIEAVGRSQGKIRIRAYRAKNWRNGRRGLRVVVADNGKGIPKEVREKVFEPFFTTKGEKGTGLGLWVTTGIISKYDGALRVRSTTRAGRSGTCFSVFLPFASAAAAADD